jgi:CubicO group peptidase (beta-lactamase class C family)
MRRREALSGAVGACALGSYLLLANKHSMNTRVTASELLEAATASNRLFSSVTFDHGVVWIPRINGASLLVKHNGIEFINRRFGSNIGTRTPFLLASISKPITAAGVMILVDRKELSLDDPVSKYIPEFNGDHRELVKVRHLLSHTSGPPDGFPELTPLIRSRMALKTILMAAIKLPLVFSPGSNSLIQILDSCSLLKSLSGGPL